MKKLFIISFALVSILGCKKDNDLVEVQIPDPEVPVTQTAFGNPADVKVDEGSIFKMKGLKYSYDALAPFIDGRTMEIHYSKHHLGYANKLNKAIVGTDLETKTIEEILTKLDIKNTALRNNAGGYYNHNLFFEILNVTVIKIIRIIKKCLIVIKISCKVQRKYVNMAKIIHINSIKY